jgi:hypothetical protein
MAAAEHLRNLEDKLRCVVQRDGANNTMNLLFIAFGAMGMNDTAARRATQRIVTGTAQPPDDGGAATTHRTHTLADIISVARETVCRVARAAAAPACEQGGGDSAACCDGGDAAAHMSAAVERYLRANPTTPLDHVGSLVAAAVRVQPASGEPGRGCSKSLWAAWQDTRGEMRVEPVVQVAMERALRGASASQQDMGQMEGLGQDLLDAVSAPRY